MATATTTYRVDDLDDSITEGVTEVKFGLHGATYTIDLGEKNAEALEAALGEFVAHARRVSGKNAKPVAASSVVDVKAVRTWAAERGIEIAPRGRIAKGVLQKYIDEH